MRNKLYPLAALAIAGSTVAHADCAGDWQSIHPNFRTEAFLGGVQALAVYDPDDAGPAPADIIAAGQFQNAGGQQIAYIARWDGQAWHPLGGGVNNIVRALCVLDADGPGPGNPVLVAGGDFSQADGGTVNFVARWDGSAWNALGEGFDATVQALAVYDADGDGPELGELYAGGSFHHSGAVELLAIARWDGAAWQDVGGGLSGGGTIFDASAANALAVYDADGDGPAAPLLVAGGTFNDAGGAAAGSIATWNGQSWSALGSGVFVEEPYPAVYAISSAHDPVAPGLTIGGFFTHADNVETWGVANWNGTNWLPMPGLMLPVTSLLHFDHDADTATPNVLLAGGPTEASGGADGIAQWNGSAWTSLGTGVNGSVYTMIAHDADGGGAGHPVALIGGIFTLAGGQSVSNLASWGCADAIPGDLDGDGDVDLADLALLLSDFGCSAPACAGDINGDGVTDLQDLATLLAHFGQ